MAQRHRIPTIFNLYMVDVLCCALGCVILLWLLNLREAKQRAEAAGQAIEQLAQTRTQLTDTDQRLKSSEHQAGLTALVLKKTEGERGRASERANSVEKERNQLSGDLLASRGRQDQLVRDLAALRQQFADNQDRLAKRTKEHGDQAKELTAIRQRALDLDVLVREKETMARTAARSADELAERLRDADARLAQLRAQSDLLPGLRAEAQITRDRLAAADARLQTLEREVGERDQRLAGASRAIESLRDERRALADQATRARAAVENRFAGITLSGKKVVFLVDMSGSMEMVDENTMAPDKWAGVRQTVAQVMRSLPDLEKFQVILFSSQARYLLGSDGSWMDFDPVTSTGRVAEALAAIKPLGNTDMYAGFEAAFRFRPLGMDTIYVFSDGLPNIGMGLTAAAAQTLRETERAEILSKYVRQTLRISWNRTLAGQARVKINTVGFFFESPDVGAFLWALARENDGSFVGMSKP